MDPVAFELFGIRIMWYGIMIAIGMIGAVLFTYFILKRDKDYDENFLLKLAFLVIIFGIIGARLYYVLFNLSMYNSFWEMLNTRLGGMAFHGGVIAGVLVIIIYTQIKKKRTFRYLDVISVGTLFAQALGRWGNFFNQEAHGGVVSGDSLNWLPPFIKEGMHINGQYYAPAFFYEFVNDMVWFIVLAILLIKKAKLKDGTYFALALLGNSLGRFFIESMRTDSLMLGPIRAAQLVSIIGILISVGLLIYLYIIKRNKNKKEKKAD